MNALANRSQTWKGNLSDEPGLQDVSIPDAMTVYGGAKLFGLGKDALLAALSKPEILINPMKAVRFPWEMSPEEFANEEAKGMGKSWLNAVRDDSGKIITSSTREHGDIVPALRDAGRIGDIDKPQYRGWTWKGTNPEDTFIDVSDLQKSGGDFYKAYLNKARR